ncbi:zf-HC2 domain-containing protein [bacterium]|nr:zf-HC2 domain-containing protein [bacterium]
MAWKHVGNLLSAYIQKELDQETAGKVENHLRNCTTCQEEYQKIHFGISLAEKGPEISAPSDLWRDIRAQLESTNAGDIPKQSWLSSWHLNTLPRFGFAMGLLLVIGLAWWMLGDILVERPQVSLTPYLTQIESSPKINAISEASFALVSFKSAEPLPACEAAGVAHVIDRDPLPEFELKEQRIRSIDKQDVVQLIYSNKKEYFSVFVAPETVDFDFEGRAITAVNLDKISCRKVEAKTLATYWFGAGGFHCVLVSPFEESWKNADVINYFVNAHNTLEKRKI